MRVRVSKCDWHPLNAGEFTYLIVFCGTSKIVQVTVKWLKILWTTSSNNLSAIGKEYFAEMG